MRRDFQGNDRISRTRIGAIARAISDQDRQAEHVNLISEREGHGQVIRAYEAGDLFEVRGSTGLKKRTSTRYLSEAQWLQVIQTLCGLCAICGEEARPWGDGYARTCAEHPLDLPPDGAAYKAITRARADLRDAGYVNPADVPLTSGVAEWLYEPTGADHQISAFSSTAAAGAGAAVPPIAVTLHPHGSTSAAGTVVWEGSLWLDREWRGGDQALFPIGAPGVDVVSLEFAE